MPRTVTIKDHLNIIDDSLTPFQLLCRSCGSFSYSNSSQKYTFCNFCEGYVDIEGANKIHENPQVEKYLEAMSTAASRGQWLQGAPNADALAATNDPYLLYGASHFYKFFSDAVYYDINYGLGGFMYSNADKRSDELAKNKYNAMALISKSKGYLFKAIKMMDSIHPEARLVYLRFMCNMRLKRYAKAAGDFDDLSAFKDNEGLFKYANMVFSIESMTGKPKPISMDISMASGSANFFYYLAKYLAKHRKLDDATIMLDKITSKVYMPMAVSYKRKVMGVTDALDF